MKVTVIGTGYVGLVSGTCFAEIGHHVTCVDINKEKVEMMKEGKSPIYEPGLSEMLTKNIKRNRLFFSCDYSSVQNSKTIFLAVGTPASDDGSADLKYLDAAAKSVAENICENAVIVIKSTVPVGTWSRIEKIVSKNTDKTFHIVNNPEFLKEGSAIDDFMRPDRVVIGFQNQIAQDVMDELYSPLVRTGNPIYFMSNTSAEMTKYAANCFLAAKISFINEIAQLCDRTGADIEEVRKGISSDRRIGKHFLYPGPGYGGSCFPKDVKALLRTAIDHGVDMRVVNGAEETNKFQKRYMFGKILNYYKEDIKDKTFAFWGAAFKARTDDVRESSAIDMAKSIIKAGGKVNFYDPEARETFLEVFKDTEYFSSITAFDDMYSLMENCDGLVIMTEWRDFQSPDFQEIKEKLNRNVIFDCRNLFNTRHVLNHGFEYFAIGKHIRK